MKKITTAFMGLGVALATLMLGGCTPKNITYVQDFEEDVVIRDTQRTAIRIQPEDKLSIIVHSKDPELAALFNLPVVANNTRNIQGVNGSGSIQRTYASSDGMSSYTVSAQGTIEFPVLGTLHIAGMTRNELSAFIKGELMGRDLVKDPTVVVEFLNSGVSILGEVRSPGRYDMNRDNITVLEAIALAGDLTIQGKRENVKVMREDTEGNVHVYVIDLTKGKQIMSSPGYYLKQNDVIYVEPTNYKKRETTVNGNSALAASFWISAASLLTSIAVLVVNLTKK
ncbi:MAG: polysaccharide biosynthesis/export family protein [Muribaculaceae bacterium]|nr:polysaccharide biosynthesis/export family protein [Muribaculaceae bacterium]